MRSTISRAVVAALSAGAVTNLWVPAVQSAEQGQGSEIELEEVVVTAQFREERLQETPLAVTAVSGEDLAERSVGDVSRIAAVAPNVSLDRTSAAFGPSISAFIRGVGQGDFNYNFEPGVGLYVDDVYHATLMGSLFQLVDLERVEVLRGPQGTLSGKNSIGGAIRLISKKPQGDNSGYIEAGYGSYDRTDLRAMFDIPLIADKLFLRASAMSQNYKGFVKRLDYVCAHPDYGAGQGYAVNLGASQLLQSQQLQHGSCEIGREGGADIQGGRVALRWLASEDVEVNLAADFTSDNSEASPTVLMSTDTNPASSYNTNAQPGGPLQQYFLDTYGVNWDDRFLTGDRRSNYSTFIDLTTGRTLPPKNAIDSWGGALTVDWTINESAHLKSVTGYRGYSGGWGDDQDTTPLPMAYVYNKVDHHAFSQELQLTGSVLDGKLDYATGVFYMDAFNRNRGRVGINVLWALGPCFPGCAPGNVGLSFPLDDPSNVKDKAGFLQLGWHATDKLTLTGGGRYTKENKDYTFWHVAPPLLNLDNLKNDSGYSRWDYRFAADYQWTPDFMTYVSVATGFKGGGLNPRPFNDTQVVAFGPETMTSYELGVKSQWFDRRLTLNADVFLGKYKDLQLSSGRPDATGAPFVGPSNVGAEDIRGVEVELNASPIDGLNINLALGYLDPKYKNLGRAVGCTGAPGEIPAPAAGYTCVTGNPLMSDTPGGPPWTGNVGVQYQWKLANGSSLTPRLDFTFRDHPPYGNSNEVFTDSRVKSQSLLNGRVTWVSSEGGWSVSAWGTNLADKDYILNYFDLRTAAEAQAMAQPGRPREWGVTLRKTF